MTQTADLAGRLLRFEQQLQAYQKLHADELAELWRALNECKQALATLYEDRTTDPAFANAVSTEPVQQNQ